MSKATILDRLAGAMKTLGKCEGKALTPRQRVAAAQRWNSLAAIAEDLARQAYNQKLIEDAVRLRKEELWREYMEEEDPPPGIGWPTGKGEELDEGFKEQARWDVQGMVNPNDNFWGITDDEFREKYKDAPWRMW